MNSRAHILTEDEGQSKRKAGDLLNNLWHQICGMIKFFSGARSQVNSRYERWIRKDPSEAPVVDVALV